MPDYATLARRLHDATIRRAWLAMQRELNAPPPRLGVMYRGSAKLINTSERAQARRKRR